MNQSVWRVAPAPYATSLIFQPFGCGTSQKTWRNFLSHCMPSQVVHATSELRPAALCVDMIASLRVAPSTVPARAYERTMSATSAR